MYSKTSGSLCKYYRDEPALENNGRADNNRVSFKFKEKITEQTGNDGAKDVETMLSLKYVKNFWRNLKIPLIKREINLLLISL